MKTSNFNLNFMLCRIYFLFFNNISNFSLNLMLQWKFDFPWNWCFVWYTNFFYSFYLKFYNVGWHLMLIILILLYLRSLILNCLDKKLKLRQFKFLQNSRNSIFDTYWNILFLYICYTVSCMSVYRHMRKNKKPVRSENLLLNIKLQHCS